jgi:hypothetical protein
VLNNTTSWTDAQSTGNRCLGVVVDSAAPNGWPVVDETVFAALRHLGLPYRVLDLGQTRLTPETLDALAVVLLAQAGLGQRLSEGEAVHLRAAVRGGLGLVCFDGDLAAYPAALRDVFGITGGASAIARSRVRLARDDHFITETRSRGESVVFAAPVAVCRLEAPGWAAPEHCLLVTDDNWPALVARPFGQGRVVAWTLALVVWTNAVLGHAMGLDDLFWKGIVWAARKPFVMRAMPPFVAFVLDDASSSYNHFGYLDVFNHHGYIAHVGVYLDDVDKVMHDVHGQDSRALKAKHDAGLVEVAAHGFSYDHQIYFDHQNLRPWPESVQADNFRRYDQKFKEWGIQPSRMLNAHFGEVGLNALPYLRERGIEFYFAIWPFGQAWFEPAATRRPWTDPEPYHYVGCAFDAMPDHPDFFAVGARVQSRQQSSAPLVSSEFLWGNTIFWDESPENNLQGAADQALIQLRRGLDSLFYGELFTHEQRIAVLSRRQLDEILTLIDRGLSRHQYVHRSLAYIAEYARCKVRSRLTAVNVDAGGQITCDLAGRTTMTTCLYLFTETDGALHQCFVDVPPFDGSVRVSA